MKRSICDSNDVEDRRSLKMATPLYVSRDEARKRYPAFEIKTRECRASIDVALEEAGRTPESIPSDLKWTDGCPPNVSRATGFWVHSGDRILMQGNSFDGRVEVFLPDGSMVEHPTDPVVGRWPYLPVDFSRGPVETLRSICDRLSPEDVVELGAVNSAWRAIVVGHDAYWARAAARPALLRLISQPSSWWKLNDRRLWMLTRFCGALHAPCAKKDGVDCSHSSHGAGAANLFRCLSSHDESDPRYVFLATLFSETTACGIPGRYKQTHAVKDQYRAVFHYSVPLVEVSRGETLLSRIVLAEHRIVVVTPCLDVFFLHADRDWLHALDCYYRKESRTSGVRSRERTSRKNQGRKKQKRGTYLGNLLHKIFRKAVERCGSEK